MLAKLVHLSMQANAVKDKLEDKQRVKRQAALSEEAPLQTAKWFECLPANKQGDLPRWRYKGGYWEARESGRWPDMPDLYSYSLPKEEGHGEPGSLQFKARAVII